MGLTFLQPLLLLGSLATAIPVLIHLIYRRRALVHYFPAVRFLLLADKRTARKFRLHQWLLLALRVLALLLLALALARPAFTTGDVQAAAALPPQALVVIIDNSLSMQYRDQGTPRLQRAKAIALQLLEALRGQDVAAVLPLLPPPDTTDETSVLNQDRNAWEAEIAALRPRHATVDLAATLKRAFDLLQQSNTQRRRLVVVSDLTMAGWENLTLSQFDVLPHQVAFHLIRVGPERRDDNVLIEHIRIHEAPFIAQVPLEVTATLRNRSATAKQNLRVDLFIGQQKAGQQLVNLAPDEQVDVPFRVTTPEAGLHWGEIRLEEDNFAEDDHYYFALRSTAPARVLIVDGDPSASLFESEVFYLLQALQPSASLQQSVFYPTPVTWEGLAHENLADYQVIVLCNIQAFAPQVLQRLQQFVASGGGLLFFAGNHVSAESYNAMLYRSNTLLMPVPLGPPVQQPETQPQAIGTVDTTHEALQLFATETALLQGGQFYRYLTLRDSESLPGVQTLLTLQDGHPLLVEKRIGNGNVMFFASTADRDWTDLPTRTAYVPLMHGLIGYLAHLSTATQRPSATLPEPVALPGRREDAGASLTARAPDGHQQVVRYTTDAAEVQAVFDAYTVAGIYRLTTPQGADVISANATRAESNFTKLQREDLQARLQPLSLVLEEEATFGSADSKAGLPAKELASLLLIAVVGLLAVENVYANRL